MSIRSDKQLLDWLDKRRQRHHAHWGGDDDITRWVDPSVSWRVSHEIRDGTYTYPKPLDELSIRDVINLKMDQEQKKTSD